MKNRTVLSGLLLVTTLFFFGIRVYDAEAEDLQDGAAPAQESPDSAYQQISVFTRALQLIRQDYVDEKKVSFHDLTYAALRGMLSSLDPHSQFMGPEDFQGMEDDTKSQFGGLGIIVSAKDGNLTIVAPMEDTPAMKVGLQPGDRIVKVNGIATEKIGVSDAMQRLRGPVGEKIGLTIFRPSSREVKDYSLERAIIKVASVKDAKLMPDEATGPFKIGYVRITQFNEPTALELGKALDSMQAQGMQALVLDLRFNPGGLLNSAVDVCGQFVAPGTLVVSTEGRSPSQSKTYRTSLNSKPRPDFPLAILVNSASASGAEIVSGALKDLNRAIVVGETTFGKGSVQSVIELPDGSALRLTTAKYYTPSHQVIHEHGVTPTIRVVMSNADERQLLAQRREAQPDELGDDDAPKISPSFKDTQLDRAVDALKGVMIYAQRRDAATKVTAAKAEPGGAELSAVVLAIETSCDETAVAILRGERELLASEIASQAVLHERYGGVVPEVASREHLTQLQPLLELALDQAGLTLEQIDAFAATAGPGLATSLMLGMSVAKGLAVGARPPVLRD